MPIRITCPHCNGAMESDEQLLGSQARCPHCREILTVQRLADTDGGSFAEAASEPNKLATNGAIPTKDDEHMPVGLVLGSAGQHRKKRNQLIALIKFFFKQGNPTDAGIVLTGLAATSLTILLYLLLVPTLSNTIVGTLLAERGWVPYVIVWLTVWSAVILLVKLWKLSTQQTALSYDLLPIDASTPITPANAELVVAHLNHLPLNSRKSFLVNRVVLALDHFKSNKDIHQVGSVLTSQADIDANKVTSSYSMLKVFIWAIPILGFIGTVLGISEAVAGFTQSIQTAQELNVIKTSLGQVTAGLAMAFDTTLIALVLSLVIMFPTNSLQKAEEDLLNEMDQFCNDNVLGRLQVHAPGAEDFTNEAYAVEVLKRLQRLEKLEALRRESGKDLVSDPS